MYMVQILPTQILCNYMKRFPCNIKDGEIFTNDSLVAISKHAYRLHNRKRIQKSRGFEVIW